MRKMKNSQRLFEQNTRPYVFFLIAFAVVTLVMKSYYLAAAEGVVILALIVYSGVFRQVAHGRQDPVSGSA